MKTVNKAALPLVCLGLGLGPTTVAAETDAWQYEFTPYLLAAGMDGTVGVRGHDTDVDVSFSDLLDHLDIGFMGIFEARKGPWSFGLEGVYMKLEEEGARTVTGPRGHVSRSGSLDVTNEMYIFQGTVGYRLLDDTTKLDLLGALRYTELKVEMDVRVNFDPPIFGGARSAGGSESWTDAVIGMRVLHPVSDDVALLGYADVGGGGSDLTYQIIAGVNWEFSDGFVAKVGYRHLYWDYEEDGNVWDMTAAGPYLGLGIQF